MEYGQSEGRLEMDRKGLTRIDDMREDGMEVAVNCPLCGKAGEHVERYTVAHLVNEELKESVLQEDEGYRICMNPKCDMVYYGHERTLLKGQVRVPVWFKEDAEPRYACYCSQVTEEQVIDAVVNHGARSIRDVNRVTGSMSQPDCEKNNPRGECCHDSVRAAIAKGMDILE
jgi:bacterioferritin-associated ferredoxin